MTGAADRLVLEALRALVRLEVEEALRARQEVGPRPEAFITTTEAARRAGVTQDTVLAWISSDKLTATRPPGTKAWRIKPGDLDRLLSAQGAPEPARLEDHRAAAAARLAASVNSSPSGAR